MRVLYHNPRCSKSRQALQLLKEKGIQPSIIEYLKEPPDVATISKLLNMLDLEPRDIMRKGEAIYKETGLDNKNLSKRELIKMLAKNPILIERPIITKDGKAVIGRPPELLLSLL